MPDPMNGYFVHRADPAKQGAAAGYADGVRRISGCIAGRPDAPYLRALARELQRSADRALACALALEEREAERPVPLPWGQGPHLIDPNHPSSRRND